MTSTPDPTPTPEEVAAVLAAAGEIGTNPTTMAFYARCGCGHVALESGTQDEAVEALEAHREREGCE